MDNEQKGKLIKAFIDVRRCLQQIAGQGELTHGEFLVLRRIRIENDGNIESLQSFKALRISQYLSMPPPAVSRILNSLEERGFIERSINQENRRSIIIKLTKNGEQVLKKAEQRVMDIMNKLTNELGEQESVKLLALLEQVVALFEKEDMLKGEDCD